MSGEDEDDDKQFDATEQKLRRAREEGDIPRSQELNSTLTYIGLWGAFALATAWLIPDWVAMAARALGTEQWPDGSSESAMDLVHGIVMQTGFSTVIFLALLALPVLVGLIVQRAIVFTPKKLVPDINRINPLKNAGQKFGPSGLASFAISVAKVIFVTVGGWLLYRSLFGWIMSSAAMGETQWMVGVSTILQKAITLAIGIGVVFAGIDLIWKRFEFMRRHRMSRKEMQDEYKDSEGDPHFKAARRQKGIDIVMNAMLADVERADVVIVNPTHYAVALEWKRGNGRAPVCLAKGVDEVARRIRERADEHRVPIWSDPPCARALHASVEIGEEIRSDQFAPVAAAIRFAEAMRKKARSGWANAPINPNGPTR
ncbi:flagellar type III secretion system protein FlhB [Paracoccus aestuariivivens]|uniref:Flagellar type III secretion system protein FlhB n=1 Tax=Paracoccus aestuariivivens TaxID=1820333 RepID=A0A6L6JDG3_9RHOB|nr:flagellar type III secretion system protein FlhB [Paracoccus aestuariivivens]MTH80030.1 flagellar type III secretion system protein FlhB [Paracoccus aestuariivivens]